MLWVSNLFYDHVYTLIKRMQFYIHHYLFALSPLLCSIWSSVSTWVLCICKHTPFYKNFHHVLYFLLPFSNIQLYFLIYWYEDLAAKYKKNMYNWLLKFWFMVFNVIFNNISVISLRSFFLVEETRPLEENHRPVTSHWQTLYHNVVSSTPRLNGNRTHNVSGDRHWLNM